MTSRSGISKRVGAIQPSKTLAITAKAAALKAEGADVIGYGAGQPNFPTPDHIVAAAAAASADPINHLYSPSAGLPELREAVATKSMRDTDLEVSPSQVVITNGGKQAIFETFAALLDPGDEVLVPSPYWVSYPEGIRLAGGVMVTVPSDISTGFKVGIDELEAALTDRTKVLLFVSPSNPTGAVYSPDEVKAVGEWALENGLWVVTDEIYEHLVYGDNRFASIPVEVPDIADQCVVINGVSKTYAMTGWRVGWLIGPDPLAKAVTNLQSHLTSNVNNVAQRAALAAVAGPLEAVAVMREAFDRRRMMMHALLNKIPGVSCLEPGGAFYAFPEMSGITAVGDRTVNSTLDLADALLDIAQVAIVPGEAFGAPGYARFSFALGDEDLERGLNRIADVVSS
ncbi:MAG: pyridoxal phosphate-dependent aminotransferase [Acidimicrobiia bacterium]|nr:pyridoxal phosphate-dependent aminotransferase [Acidimicrobiia bacterium]